MGDFRVDNLTDEILLLSFLLIYALTLGWDALKRDEPYGNFAYITALLPANFAWYMVMGDLGSGNSFNALGAAALLVTLWLVAMVRDIYSTRIKKKDLDDVVLYLLVGILIQLILYAVLPTQGVVPSLNDNLMGGTATYWSYWVLPNITWQGYDPRVLLWFRFAATGLVLAVAIPMISDLKGTKVHPGVLIIITIFFAIPLAFLSYIWLPGPDGSWAAIFFLLTVLFLMLLLVVARGQGTVKH
jgi:hypothetical protein